MKENKTRTLAQVVANKQFVDRIEMYCDNPQCAVRDVTIHFRYDDMPAKELLTTPIRCNVCRKPMIVSWHQPTAPEPCNYCGSVFEERKLMCLMFENENGVSCVADWKMVCRKCIENAFNRIIEEFGPTPTWDQT